MDNWLDVYDFIVGQIKVANTRAEYWMKEAGKAREELERLQALLDRAGINAALEGGDGE